MNSKNIQYLSHDAARLLLALLSYDGSKRLSDLPQLIVLAGLTKRRYVAAYKQLTDLGFIEYRNHSICVLFEPGQ